MSYSSNRRDALDAGMPIAHRRSHARSCTVAVAEKFEVHRDEVIDRVLALTGVDLRNEPSTGELTTAIECLDSLRVSGLD